MKTDKKSEKKLGRLRSLVHKHDAWYMIKDDVLTRLDKMIKSYSGHSTGFCIERYKAFIEIKKLFSDLELTDNEYYQICCQERVKINESVTCRNARNNAKETRDNKGVYVGSGNGEHQYAVNKIRYPRKTRSKRVWSIFYKMFPSFAEKDGWDGEKSSRTI